MGRREGKMKDMGMRRCGINRSRTDGAICGGIKPGSGEGKEEISGADSAWQLVNSS